MLRHCWLGDRKDIPEDLWGTGLTWNIQKNTILMITTRVLAFMMTETTRSRLLRSLKRALKNWQTISGRTVGRMLEIRVKSFR